MSQRMSRRDFLTYAGLTGAAAVLAACGGAPAPAPAPTAAPQPAANQAEPTKAPVAPTAVKAAPKFKKTSLSIPSWWAPHEIAGAEAAFNKYFTPDTGVTVKYDYIGSADYDAKVFTRLASGDPYDVITYNADRVPQYLARGVLKPLDELVTRDKFDLTDFDSKAIDQWTHNGKLYGLANDMGSFHAYFNIDAFKKAGLTAPKPTDEWTWSQLLDWGKKLTIKSGDQITQYGLATMGLDGTGEFFPNMNGAFLYDEKLTKSLLDDPKVIEAEQFFQTLAYKENVALRPGTTKTSTQDLFAAGQVAIMLNGTWQVGYLRSKKADVKFTWDVGLLPHNDSAKEYYIPNFTAGWVLPTVAKDIDASWEALKFYASKTFAEEVMFNPLSSLPTRKSALQGGKFYQWPNNPPEGITPAFYGKLLELGRSRRHLKFDLGSSVIASMAKLSKIYSNEAKPEELLPELAREVTQGLKDRPWNK